VDFSQQFPHNPPELIQNGLEVGTLAEVGLDTKKILNIVGRIRQGRYKEVHTMQYLFEPLGIDTASWYVFDSGSIASEGSLYLKPRDMLKFGVLYLNQGVWDGEQVIPREWAEKSSMPFGNNKGIRIPIDDSGKNMVVVFTGGNYTARKRLHEILERFIYPATFKR
jgi:CubicO group peptidase (beta-lactamase class C family)